MLIVRNEEMKTECATVKEASYWMEITALTLILLPTFALSSNDRLTHAITAFCFASAAGLSYLRIRRRLNIIGILLLIISVYFLANLIIFTLTS